MKIEIIKKIQKGNMLTACSEEEKTLTGMVVSVQDNTLNLIEMDAESMENASVSRPEGGNFGGGKAE